MVEASALEHRLGARRLNPGNLKGMKDSVRADFDEGVAQTLLPRSTVTRASKTRS